MLVACAFEHPETGEILIKVQHFAGLRLQVNMDKGNDTRESSAIKIHPKSVIIRYGH